MRSVIVVCGTGGRRFVVLGSGHGADKFSKAIDPRKEGAELARFNLSPSRLARFYFHECDRYLRYAAATKEQRAVDGIPPIELDRNLVTKAVLESGYVWEREIVEVLLGDRAVIADAHRSVPLHRRRHSVEQTLEVLGCAPPGTAIYQPTLRAPDSFYETYDLDPELVRLVDCHPDLVMVDSTDAGIELRVVDAKASSEMKLAHRIQTALYTLLLRHAVEAAGLDDALGISRVGGVWLYGRAEPEWFELARIAPQLETFLTHELTPLLETPAAEAFWHVAFRCEWCDYYDHCRAEADATDSVSLVPYLSTFGKRHLHDVAGVDTVDDLRRTLERPDRDELPAGSASLEGTAHELQLAVEALESGQERPTGAASVGMPVGEQIRVVMTLQSEPVSGALYGFAINRVFAKELFGTGAYTIARIASDGSPETVAALRRDLVRDLSTILRLVHAHNTEHADDWAAQKSLQAYVFDSYERELLVQALLLAVADPEISEDALALLFHFQHPDLASADEHPATEVFFPVVVLTSVIRNLLALPIPVAYRFADVVAAVRPSDHPFDYRHDDFWSFALSNRMKSNAIFEVWNRGRDDLVVSIERELQRRVWAAGSVINGLRERLKGTGALFAWPPKFFLPAGFGLSDPLLSRLSFITKYEEVLAYLQVRATRTRPADERFAVGDSFLLRAESDGGFGLDDRHAEHDLAPDEFPNWILTLDDDEGRRARLAYDDFIYRSAMYAPKSRPVALARILAVAEDGAVKLNLTTRDAWIPPRVGQHCVLEPRYTDWLSRHVISELTSLDDDGDSWFAAIVADPAGTRTELRTSQTLRDRALALAATHWMTPSQLDAFAGMLDHDLQLVWGPPGTGKTHFLALALLCFVEAHRQANRLRVLVTGFTNAAIDNCLDKIDTLQEQLHLVGGPFGLCKLSSATPRVPSLEPKSAPGFCVRHDLAIVGATVWQARKTEPAELRYDVVVIDEGSQLTVADSALAIRRLRDRGRLVIAGDDRQLPPIVQGDYPEVDDEPVLHRSILECLRGRDDTGAPVTSLLENFRMCDVLCEYPRRSIYPDEYRPASSAIAEARLVFDGAPGQALGTDPELARFLALVLDPHYPAVTCVLEGIKATSENLIEAALVADLATELRRLMGDGDDEVFWHVRLFVVSPHNAQIRAIQRELTARRDWDANPFVSTVDKMQGQECDAVIVSYGVSDVEYALGEKEFIYSLNRLNVAVTRARMKSIVLLSRSLLEPPIQALDRDDVADGIAFMQGYARFCEEGSETTLLTRSDVAITVYRA
jgi:DNA replication ATP-dependent helicase Dna2